MTIDVDSLPVDTGDEIERIMRKYHIDLLQRGYEDAALTLGLEAVFDLDNPIIQEQLDDLALKVRRVAESTKEEIRALVGKQAAEGWSVDRLADEIAALGEIHSVERARLIARTETASAYSRGALTQYHDSGVVDRKQWILGPEPCGICEALGGKVVGLDDDFDEGTPHPPRHPNCTCDFVAVLKER